jgi:hypothetical protein
MMTGFQNPKGWRREKGGGVREGGDFVGVQGRELQPELSVTGLLWLRQAHLLKLSTIPMTQH